MSATAGRLVAFVGAYSGEAGPGGITVLGIERSADGAIDLRRLSRIGQPREAGYLAYAHSTRTLYAVDERKNDGRGPVGPAASIHAFAVDPDDGGLTFRNALAAPAPFPTYLAIDGGRLLSANHGGFDHVERVVRTDSGGWTVQYQYDDSAVLVYRLRSDGSLDRISDVHVTSGHGTDPNGSPQAGGHAQSASHAHSVVVDPGGRYALVGDKGTDQIRVFRLGDTLRPVSTFQAEPETGPRHLAFDPATGVVYATYEFSSELVSFAFDVTTGELRQLDRVATTAGPGGRANEPADVRVHPDGRFVYVNNRGEDTLAWFRADGHGRLTREGSVRLADSVHPGLAARSFAFDPPGDLLLLADRPAGLVRAFTVDRATGALSPAGEAPVADAAFVTIVALR